MQSIEAIRILLLAVLLSPLLFAALVGVAGRSGYGGARRLASALALLHLGMTVALAIPTVQVLSDHSEDEIAGTRSTGGFRPLFVPGDIREGHSHETSWDVFPIGVSVPGMPPATVQFFVGVDGINIWLVLLASVLTYVATLSSWDAIKEKAGGFYAWVFVLQSAVIGAFLSFDMILFYVFFELTLIPAFFLIGSWGTGGGKRDAARKFFLYTFLGSLFTLTGFIGVAVMNPTPVSPDGKTVQRTMIEERGFTSIPQPGPVTFNVNQLMRNVATWSSLNEAKVQYFSKRLDAATAANEKAKRDKKMPDRELDSAKDLLAKAQTERDQYKTIGMWLFFAIIAGFAVKTPIIPFHTWLPAAYSEARTSVTILLTGVLSKLGTLGILRFVIPLCPDAAIHYGLPAFGFLGAVGIVYAAFCAFAQRDLKLLSAYSSISHLGLLILGMFALNAEGLTGASLHMINHGLTAGAMFAMLGFLADRYRTTDMTQFGGLIAQYPRYAAFMFVICLASVGLPGLNSFISEMLLIGALFTPGNTLIAGYGLAVAAGFGIFLSAWYTMSMLRRVFFGPLQLPATELPPRDTTPRELVAFGLPAVLCLALGLFPQVVLKSMKADVSIITQQVNDARARENPASAKLEQGTVVQAPGSHK
jgi:NADH-quinone oxidoreductase subunit M